MQRKAGRVKEGAFIGTICCDFSRLQVWHHLGQACWCRGTSTTAIRPVFNHMGWLKLSTWDDGEAETNESIAATDTICSETLGTDEAGWIFKVWLDDDATGLMMAWSDVHWPELLTFATNVLLRPSCTLADLKEVASCWSETTEADTTCSAPAADDFFDWTFTPEKTLHWWIDWF